MAPVITNPYRFAGDKPFPLTISNCIEWFDASDSTSITKDGSDRVSQWSDKSGNANHMVQSTAGKQPLWTESDRNSLDVIDFASSRLMTNSYALEAQPITIFMVMEAPSTGQFMVDGVGSSNRSAIFCGGGDSDLQINSGNTLAGGASVSTNWCVGHAVFDGASSEFDWTDGTNTETASGNAGTQGSIGHTFGVLFTQSSDFYNRKMAEFACYGKEVTGSELSGMLSYLSEKWGF